MSVCDTCEHSGRCKEQEFVRHIQFEQHLLSCSGFKQKENKTDEYENFKAKLKQSFANNKEKKSWVITENGCVITCPNCGERLELCYPDGTEVRYLPYCPWCGKKLDK